MGRREMRHVRQLTKRMEDEIGVSRDFEKDGLAIAAQNLREKAVRTRETIEAMGEVGPSLIERARNLGHHVLSGARKGNT
jgi:hypothetical protein